MSKKYYKELVRNRKAFHDFFITETYKAGVVLQGAEVKSVRMGRANFKDSFARVDKGELWLYNMHISPYEKGSGIGGLGSQFGSGKSDRVRKLLVTGRELRKITGRIMEKGMVAIPTKLFLEGNWVKVEIGLGKAKKKFEKREVLKKKTQEREVEKALQERTK